MILKTLHKILQMVQFGTLGIAMVSDKALLYHLTIYL